METAQNRHGRTLDQDTVNGSGFRGTCLIHDKIDGLPVIIAGNDDPVFKARGCQYMPFLSFSSDGHGII